MKEYWLLLCFIGLTLLVSPLVFYPLRKTKLAVAILAPLFIVVLTCLYCAYGAWSDWSNYEQKRDRQQQVEALLRTIKSPAELIERLNARLQAKPDSRPGWYLLGRLYASQGQWQSAAEAFFKAHQLNPDDDKVTVNYGQSLWQLNQQHFDASIRTLFVTLLQKHPEQPDALAMLAMDSFMNHDYQQAIHYWQRLLKLAPKQSEEARMIQKAIAKAQQQV